MHKLKHVRDTFFQGLTYSYLFTLTIAFIRCNIWRLI